MTKPITKNTLFYGDNLPILREYIPDESVDLIYLDPPFNSNRSYNVLFKDESGKEADAQITAFEDTWHWGQETESTYHELLQGAPPKVSSMISALREFIGENQMMAYLVMMTARLIELHRVLKPTGSLYLHCDPTASHYLKVVMDTVFGPENFLNEIIWKRTTAHSSAKKYGPVHDILLFYARSEQYAWNQQYEEYEEGYTSAFYGKKDERGYYQPDNLTAAGIRSGESGEPWRGINPTEKGRHWAVSVSVVRALVGDEKAAQMSTQQKLDLLDQHGYIQWPAKGGMPRFKRYLDTSKGLAVQDVIIDIPPISSQARERLGYPTQKPLALLERIIQASSNEGHVVLDPFCGCGTAIAAAEKLKRQWIGVDITHLSITLMKYRLKDSFGLVEKQDYDVIGEPESLDGARQLAQDNRYQFQWWALSKLQALPLGGQSGSKEGKKGSDKGIDGVINIINEKKDLERVLVQVKSGHVKSGDIRDLRGTIEREGAAIGVFITLEEPSRDMVTEAVKSGFYRSELWQQDYPRIQILTVQELLDGRKISMPRSAPGQTFKKAEKIRKKGPTQDELF